MKLILILLIPKNLQKKQSFYSFTLSSLFLILILMLTNNCTSIKKNVFSDIKSKSYNALKDPVTIWTALSATTLYTFNLDDEITKKFVNEDVFFSNSFSNEDIEIVRYLNGGITIATASLINDHGNYYTKTKRILVELSAFLIGNEMVKILNNRIKKQTPNKLRYDAIGSHHSLEPFSCSAMTKRNMNQMKVNNAIKYSIIGTNYLLASISTLFRVKNGDHSIADQLVSVSLGHFIGLFVYDLFMENNASNVSINLLNFPNNTNININFNF